MSRVPGRDGWSPCRADVRPAPPSVQHVVIAKEPVPGRVKTRLCPPCTSVEAAAIAEASLVATLRTVHAAATARGPSPVRPILALDGRPGPWLPVGFDLISQRGRGLDERLTAAFADCFESDPDRPVILVGMDTPQLTPTHLARAARLLEDNDAVLGPAPDGGYWLIGLRHLAADAITGVPMSVDDTFERQRQRLVACGYRVAVTDTLVDVDDVDDARAVAGLIPRSAFAHAVRAALSPRTGT